MKFSYKTLKKFVPRIKNKAQIVRALTMHTCEAEGLKGNVIDVSLPPNRYADMASHIGVAREIAAALKLPLKIPKLVFEKTNSKLSRKVSNSTLKVVVKDHTLCPRYSAQTLHLIAIKPSPRWMQNALKDCGVRPINNVVDVMNYVMLEVGQPLHAFDFDKLSPKGKPTIIIRKAKKGETMTSIDGNRFALNAGTLLITDPVKPLAIAGIKGGKGSEVTEKTKNIIIESANFDPISIYRTSRSLSLITDASLRFSHGLSPVLTYPALERAVSLLCEIAGARRGEIFDSRTKPFSKHILAVDTNHITKFLGSVINQKDVADILERLGFRVKKKSSRLFVEVPQLRTDISTHEDIAEEIVRFMGYQKIRSVSPRVPLIPATQDGIITLRERVGNILQGFGIDEIKTHSFVVKEDIFARNNVLELENPPSDTFKYLRQSLIPGLLRAAQQNKKFFNEVNIFEVGNIFSRKNKNLHTEHTSLGAVITGKKNESLFALKGMVDALVRALGISAVALVPSQKGREIMKNESFYGMGSLEKSSCLIVYIRKTPLGFLGISSNKDYENVATLELNLSLLLKEVNSERAFTTLPKYPAVIRDISILVNRSTRIGDVLQEISLSNKTLIENVDLVDEYIDEKWGGKQSLAFRITFQAYDRTLKSEEVDKEMKKIDMLLKRKFNATVR